MNIIQIEGIIRIYDCNAKIMKRKAKVTSEREGLSTKYGDRYVTKTLTSYLLWQNIRYKRHALV